MVEAAVGWVEVVAVLANNPPESAEEVRHPAIPAVAVPARSVRWAADRPWASVAVDLVPVSVLSRRNPDPGTRYASAKSSAQLVGIYQSQRGSSECS